MSTNFAAAGLAEAAWAMEAAMIFIAMAVVGAIALAALLFRSRILAAISVIFLVGATLFFEPWYCFTPFEPAAYVDPDVQSAGEMFCFTGKTWVAACVAASIALLVTLVAPKWFKPAAGFAWLFEENQYKPSEQG